MKYLLIILFCLFNFTNAYSQIYNELVDEIIQKTSLDSLVKTVRELSGEDSTIINGDKTRIVHRVNKIGNELAGEYLKERLEGYGLDVIEQDFLKDGKNIYAVKLGTVYPEKYYILSSHYDSVHDFCADDNASGSSVVIEAARILKDYNLDYSLVFAFWDKEEEGLLGSKYFAELAQTIKLDIKGSLVHDMLGYDGNEDMLFDIHTSDSSNSHELKDYVINMLDLYDSPLVPSVKNPGSDRSDHASFWFNGYSSILFGEAFFSGDGNPYYHTNQDRIDKFSLPYYLELSKLSIGNIASLAGVNSRSDFNSLNDDNFKQFYIEVSPNPVRELAIVNFEADEDNYGEKYQVIISDIMGREIKVIKEGIIYRNNNFSIDFGDLEVGIYILSVNYGNEIMTYKLIKE